MLKTDSQSKTYKSTWQLTHDKREPEQHGPQVCTEYRTNFPVILRKVANHNDKHRPYEIVACLAQTQYTLELAAKYANSTS